MPNGTKLTSDNHVTINVKNIAPNALIAHLFPGLTSHSLLSIGQLCNAGCRAIFDTNSVKISYEDETILAGDRNHQTGLWMIPVEVQQELTQEANNAIDDGTFVHETEFHQANFINGPNKAAELVAFAHATLFSPALTTLMKAVKNNFLIGFPGLTAAALLNHPPITAATAQGHLDQVRKNQRSTKKAVDEQPLLPIMDQEEVSDEDDELYPEQLTEGRTYHCYAAVVAATRNTGQVYSDQTGKFSVPGSSGATLVFVMYDYDTNSIHAVPLKNRSAPEIVKAYSTVYNTLIKAGQRPLLQRLDNECSKELREFMEDRQVQVQLVPPGIHRANAAERAIRTFKNHMIAGLSTTDPDFPLHLWDRLILQGVITLNLLRASRVNPRLSAYAQVFGQFAFNDTPLAPPGCHVMVHEKPHLRESWAPHAVDAWYTGPALSHYRCYRVHVWSTKKERITDTLTWLPKTVPYPHLTPTEAILQSTSQIVTAIENLHEQYPSTNTTENEEQIQALQQFHEILGTIPLTIRRRPPAPTITPPTKPTSITTAPEPRVIPAPEPRVEEEPPPLILQQGQEPTYLQEPPTIQAPEPPRRSSRRRKPTYRLLEGHLSASAINVDTGKLTEYRQLLKSSQGPQWEWAGTEEFARLAQGLPTKGIPVSEGTNTIKFIPKSKVPKNRKATYAKFVVADRPHKAKKMRVRMTVGGDKITYPFEVATKSADLATVKIHLNSTISTKNGKFGTIDVKDFYLNTIMKHPEYMRVHLSLIPRDIIIYYELEAIADEDGYVYIEINKGMYGLPQAGKLANDELVVHLEKHGYYQSKYTPGYFSHETRPISFCLVVDDFGIKYVDDEDFDHLVSTLREKYVITIDKTGTQYLGLTLDWDYEARTVDISMPDYIEKALARFQHTAPTKAQHSPHAWQKPNYGATQQMTNEPDDSPPLDAKDVTLLQQIIGTLLYYARAVDSSMLVALGSLAAAQTKATQNTMTAAKQLLDYAATHPDAKIRFLRSDMILQVHSDASYLSESEARSRAGGIAFMGNDSITTNINGAIHIHSSIMKNILASAAEAEVGALFHNAQDACSFRQTLIDMGHEQPPTPIQTDNACANGIMNSTVKQKRSKAIDMKYYWLRDRVDQEQFHVHWQPGSTNKADYFTKHHPPSHHKEIRSTYFYDKNAPAAANYVRHSEGVLKSYTPNTELPPHHRPTTDYHPEYGNEYALTAFNVPPLSTILHPSKYIGISNHGYSEYLAAHYPAPDIGQIPLNTTEFTSRTQSEFPDEVE